MSKEPKVTELFDSCIFVTGAKGTYGKRSFAFYPSFPGLPKVGDPAPGHPDAVVVGTSLIGGRYGPWGIDVYYSSTGEYDFKGSHPLSNYDKLCETTDEPSMFVTEQLPGIRELERTRGKRRFVVTLSETEDKATRFHGLPKVGDPAPGDPNAVVVAVAERARVGCLSWVVDVYYSIGELIENGGWKSNE